MRDKVVFPDEEHPDTATMRAAAGLALEHDVLEPAHAKLVDISLLLRDWLCSSTDPRGNNKERAREGERETKEEPELQK